ncbi:MAG: HEAT repeat domain-containing protein [Phycisphaerae bacterium]|jgi:HEAT repeat protein|nr:HEAT repeat domain-containing protein [Phycisphaerae bacterium]
MYNSGTRLPLKSQKQWKQRDGMMRYALVTLLLAVGICAVTAGAEGATGNVDAKIRTLRVALSYGDTEAKIGAIGEVAKLGQNGEGTAGLLVKALSDSDARVRMAAVGALGKIGPSTKQVIGVLTKLVEEKNAAVAREAVNALRLIGPSAAPAVDALIKYARGKGVNERKLAIDALGMIGPAADRAVPMIIQACKSPDRNLREGATRALGNIGQPVETVVPVLIAALGDSDSSVRVGGARGLGMIGPPAAKAQTALRKALKDANPAVVLRATWALGQLEAGDEQTIAALIKLLHSSNEYPLAAAALGKAGKPGIDALVKMLARPDAPARLMAVRALGQIGRAAGNAAPAVRKAKYDKDADVRRAAILALDKIFLNPAKRVNALTVSGKHSLVCRSSWHSTNKSWPLEGKVSISGAEALAMITPKSKPAKDQYTLPMKLAVSLGERLFKAAQFTPAQKQELAKWLGSGKQDEKSSSRGTMTATSKTHLTSGGTTQVEISLKGRIRIERSHRLADRYGPNWNEAKWSIDILGQLVVDSTSGQIIKANITATGQTKGYYGTRGSLKGELYTESFKMVLVPAPAPKVK